MIHKPIKDVENNIDESDSSGVSPVWQIISNYHKFANKVEEWLESNDDRLQSVGLFILSEVGIETQDQIRKILPLINHPWQSARAYLIEACLPYFESMSESEINQILSIEANGDKNLEKYIDIAKKKAERIFGNRLENS
mmetsp:Transcript_9920/g.14591  ORF Transcript_9920/g.14591 Transcript_9920/m.14591 type:complete len:139 (-) Transcript_9920:64-480(-)